MSTIIAAIPLTLVEYLWADVEPHLARAVATAEDEVSLSTIKAKLLRGDSLLLSVIKDNKIIAAVVAEKVTYESGMSALVLPIVGGDELDEWMGQLLGVAKLIAKDVGCQELRGLGARKGWVRKLRNEGWSEAYSVLKYKLED